MFIGRKMIVYIDLEHESILDNPGRRKDHLWYQMDLKLKFEEISGLPCLVQRYSNVNLSWLHDAGVQAMIISGNATDWAEYEVNAFDNLYEIIRAAEIPILGLCGGHQVMGMAHGHKKRLCASCTPARPTLPTFPLRAISRKSASCPSRW